MKLLLLLGPPDASLAFTAALLGAQDCVAPLPPGRLLTALAHVGIEDNIDKASYDHILAGPAQRLFLEGVEGGLAAWPMACRAYLEALIAAASAVSNAPSLIDSAPEYARLWPLLERIAPDADAILLVRNPVATAAAVLQDACAPRAAAHLETTLEQLARLVRAQGDEIPLLRFERLVDAPDAELAQLGEMLSGSWSFPHSMNTALEESCAEEREWPLRLAANPALLRRVRAFIERIPPRELEALGYPWAVAWAPVEAALGGKLKARRMRLHWHAGVRSLTARVGRFTATRPGIVAKVRQVKLACEVLLRE